MFNFHQMTQKEAEEIANNWKYSGMYSFYDMTADEEDYAEFIDPIKRGNSYFSCYVDGFLIAYYSVNIIDENNVEIGLGLKPEFTGNGNGLHFVHAVMAHVTSQYGDVNFMLSVASFNQRAIKVYKKAGFISKGVFTQNTNGGIYEFLRMAKENKMDIKLRKATISDIPLLIKLRIDFILDEKGTLTTEQETAIKNQLQTYFAKHIPAGTCIAILAEANGEVVSTAYLSTFEKPANTAFPTGITATIYNVLTYPDHRRKGIATKVINKIIEEAKQTNISRIELSATESGRPVYEKLGFKKSSYAEMSLRII